MLHHACSSRYGRAVAVQGGLQQLPGRAPGAEGATRGRRGAEVLRQLFRGAKLLLEQEREKASGMRSVPSLGFRKLVIGSPAPSDATSLSSPVFFPPLASHLGFAQAFA